MKKTEFTYLSANGSSQIHAILWEPENKPKAILQIAHGITEHIGRYEEAAEYFTKRGYIVVGNDHLGHGLSLDREKPLPMYFGGENSWQYVKEDIRTCTVKIKEKYPGLPYCLLGHSLGSFAVRCLLEEYSDLADLSVWSGTGHMNGIELAIAGAIVKREEKCFGDKHNTPLLQKLTMDTYNQKFRPCRTSADWLCAAPEAVDEYLADPLCGDGFTVGSFRELLRGMRNCSSKAHLEKLNKNIPVLMISGGLDPVGGQGKGVQTIYGRMRKMDFADISLKLYTDMRHDIFREKEKEQVFTDIYHWIEKRI